MHRREGEGPVLYAEPMEAPLSSEGRMRLWACITILTLIAVSACQAPVDSAASSWSCGPDEPVTALASGDGERPAWRLLAGGTWEGHPYSVGIQFDGAGASLGCGTVGDNAALLAFSGGGFEFEGRQVRYVYGAVLPPAASIRITYQDGPVVEVVPVAVDGIEHRFFAHVIEAPGGFSAEALDERGVVIDAP